MRKTDLSGKIFGRLRVVGEILERDQRGAIMWSCECSCGKKCAVVGGALTSGNTKSCGCLSSDIVGLRNKEKRKYSIKNNRIFNCWHHMMARCENPNNSQFKNYGGRGIRVCPDWRTFEKFQEWAIENGYSDSLSVDRINVNGNYEPTNCKWSTAKEQGNNRREHHLIEIQGIIRNITQWAERTGLHYKTILAREKLGWKGEDLISKQYELRGRK